jgi:hypothetical protein
MERVILVNLIMRKMDSANIGDNYKTNTTTLIYDVE